MVLEASDDAFGVLQLSASAVSVAEDYVGPIINVTRQGGIFADVSVKFRAVPLTARVSKCRLRVCGLSEATAPGCVTVHVSLHRRGLQRGLHRRGPPRR